MSFLPENEVGNFICDWKIENLEVEVKNYNGRVFSYCPMTKSKLGLNLLWSDEENNRRRVIKLVLSGVTLNLSGTIFLVTAGKTVHVLGQFEDHRFEINKWKNVALKDPREFQSENDILFPNNTLTLRIHLWKPSVKNKMTVKHFVYSKYTEEKCLFPWIVKSETDDSENECFTEYITEVPRSFTSDVINSFRISMAMKFGTSLDADDGITMMIKAPSLFGHCLAKFEIDAISETGISKSLLNTQWIPLTEETTDYQCPKTGVLQELKSNKLTYFPKGYLNLHCNVIVRLRLSAMIEDVCYISDNQSPECDAKQNPSEDTLQDCMYTLYSQGEFCDVTLCTGGEKFPCHKAVLCARSSVFKAMFQNDMSEKENGLVDILDVDTRALGSFLTALYTDTLGGLDWEGALNVYAIADKYAVPTIQKKCIAFILPKLSTSNVCEVLELADTHHDEELKSQAQEFVFKHAKGVIKSAGWSELMSRNPLLTAQVMQLVVLSER